jgi:L-2-hydroxyglutarate oxidase LhgO
VPHDELSLGVHITRTVDGELWLGPDAKYVARKDDYEADRRPVAEFLPSAQKLCPSLQLEDLRLGQSGIRPKLCRAGEPVCDFVVEPQPDDGRIMHLVGIESPGLTASPAIARLVAESIERSGVL